jgi:hypothetical protein
MDHAYTAYGLRLLADGDIPGLPTSTFAHSDVRVHLNKMPAKAFRSEQTLWYQSSDLNQQGRPNLVIRRIVPPGAFHFVYDNQTEFLIEPDGSQVWCTWPETATVADTALYLRGPILGFALRIRGVLCLHASAVALGSSAIALVGPPGAGKSTTAAGFVKLGYSLVADDVAALSEDRGRFHVSPGYPQLNLWPDAIETVFGDAGASSRLAPAGGINGWWDKRYVDLEGDRQFHRSLLPLAAVYVLGERTTDDDAPRVDSLSPQDAFMWLTGETYVNYALDESMRAKEFQTLGRLVRAIPIRLVHPPDKAARLLDLCQSILADYRRLL